MLQHDRASLCRSYNRGVHITPVWLVHKLLVKVILCSEFLSQRAHHKIVARHRYQEIHFIAPVNVHDLAYRSNPMSGVQIAVSADVFFQPPLIIVLIPGKVSIQQMMYVRSFAMNDLSEKTLPGHIQHQQFKKPITGIFHHHAVLTGPFGGFYQLPAMLECSRSRYFDAHMLSMIHGMEGHGRVETPGGSNEYQINVILFAYLFPCILVAGVEDRIVARTFQPFFGFDDTVGAQVTQSLYFDTLYLNGL